MWAETKLCYNQKTQSNKTVTDKSKSRFNLRRDNYKLTHHRNLTKSQMIHSELVALIWTYLHFRKPGFDTGIL